MPRNPQTQQLLYSANNKRRLRETLNSNNTRVSLVALAVASLVSPFASADEEFKEEDEQQFEHIIVTAQKREERIQDVPVSIANFYEDEIEKLGAGDFSDFAASVPGISMAKTGVGGARYFIRGVGQVTVNQSPTTAVYFDETPLQIRTSFGVAQVDPKLFDIRSVEVLRGPQGALFGSSSMGGAIRIQTNKPELDELDANVDFIGSTTEDGENNTTLSGMVNVPLPSINGAFRLAAMIDEQGGWIDDIRPVTNDVFENFDNPIHDVNDVSSDSIRAALKIEPTDNFSVTGTIFYQDQNADQQRPSVDMSFDEEGEIRMVHKYQDTFTDDETWIYSLDAEWDLSDQYGFTVVSATGYMDREVDGLFDISPFGNGGIEGEFTRPAEYADNRFIVGLYNDTDVKQFTQEIRLTSMLDGPWDYVVGVFYRDIETTMQADRRVTETWGSDVPPILREQTTDFEEDEIALFGQLGYRFNDQWKISLGGRYFNIDQDEYRLQYGRGGAAVGNEDYNFADDNSESGFSPRAVVTFTPDERTNLYLSYSEGFRSGGINAPIVDDVCSPEARAQYNIPAVPEPFDSDEAQTLELGTKLNYYGGRLSVAASVYKTDWEDFQLSVQQDCGPESGVAVFTSNVGKVEIDGFEFETTFYPIDELRVSAGYAYTDAVFAGTNNPNLASRGLQKDDELFDVPENTWNLRLEYTTEITDELDGFIFTSAQYVDESLSGFGEGEAPERPDYTLINFRVGVFNDKWEVALFVNNLTDEVPIYGIEFGASTGNTTATNDFSALVGQPRTMGINLKYRL